jgi:hypothetical protein
MLATVVVAIAGIKLHEKEKQQRQNLKRWLSCVG